VSLFCMKPAKPAKLTRGAFVTLARDGLAGLGVTTPSEIIPYYRLNHSIWSLSDNKESSC
jgi:hypothetical protein